MLTYLVKINDYLTRNIKINIINIRYILHLRFMIYKTHIIFIYNKYSILLNYYEIKNKHRY